MRGDIISTELDTLKTQTNLAASAPDQPKKRPKTKGERDWGSGATLRKARDDRLHSDGSV